MVWWLCRFMLYSCRILYGRSRGHWYGRNLQSNTRDCSFSTIIFIDGFVTGSIFFIYFFIFFILFYYILFYYIIFYFFLFYYILFYYIIFYFFLFFFLFEEFADL